MNSSKSYCKSIYKRFNKNEQLVFLYEFIENTSIWDEADWDPLSELDNHYCAYYQEITLNKKEGRQLREVYEEIAGSYSRKISHLHPSTINLYANIVSRFILNSSSLDHKGLESFIILLPSGTQPVGLQSIFECDKVLCAESSYSFPFPKLFFVVQIRTWLVLFFIA